MKPKFSQVRNSFSKKVVKYNINILKEQQEKSPLDFDDFLFTTLSNIQLVCGPCSQFNQFQQLSPNSFLSCICFLQCGRTRLGDGRCLLFLRRQVSRTHILPLLNIFAFSSEPCKHQPAQMICCAQVRHPRLPRPAVQPEGGPDRANT